MNSNLTLIETNLAIIENFLFDILSKLELFHYNFGELLTKILISTFDIQFSILILYFFIYLSLYYIFYTVNFYNLQNIYLYIFIYAIKFFLFFLIDYCLKQILPDNLFIFYLSSVFNIQIFYILIMKWIKLFVSLHDWSVGIPINIIFAKEIIFWISYCFYVLILLIPLYKVAVCLQITIVPTCLLCICYSCILLFITFFIRKNRISIIDEFDKQFAIIFDMIIFYILLIFFSLLCFTEINNYTIFLACISSILCYFSITCIDIINKNLIKFYQKKFSILNDRLSYRYIPYLIYNIFFTLEFNLLIYIWQDYLININFILESNIILYLERININLLGVCIIFEVIYFSLAQIAYNLLSKIELTSFAAERSQSSIVTLFKFGCTLLEFVQFIFICLILLIINGLDTSILISNISWLFAGISFVLQSEIKGLLNLFGLLISDSISIGDLVEIENTIGEIEEITMKYIKIRAIDGSLIIIPYYNIHTLINRSRDYSYILINIAVARYVSIGLVEQALEYAINNIIKANILNTIKIGAIEHRGIVESNLKRTILQSRIKCSPGKQFIIKRALNLEILHAIKKFNIDLGEEGGIIYNQNTSISNSSYKII